MSAEKIDLLNFLQAHPPFDQLPQQALEQAASNMDVAYYKAGSQIVELGQLLDTWHVIRSGSVEVYRRSGELYNRLSEGGYFGEVSLLQNRPSRFPVIALEDCLIYLLPKAVFSELFDSYEYFSDVVEVEDRSRLRHSVSQREDANQLMTASVKVLLTPNVLSITETATAHQAAIKMSENGISCLLITDLQSQICGIVTNTDLRDRLLTPGLALDTPVNQIMSPRVFSVEHNQQVFEAMLLMLRHNVHHLPVLKQGSAIGIITLPDIIRYETQNSLFVVSSIFKAQTLDELVSLKADVRACFVRMVREDANSRMIGGAMAVIGRSFKQRLLELGEAQLGPAPVEYCFVAMGSMAREEQLIVTDQDNAFIFDDNYQPSLHGEYFAQLGKFVCDGLAACGYSYCTGEIMASNPKWRQPLKVWQQYFSQWIDQPTPEFLLNAAIFFDLQPVYGKSGLVKQLNQLIRYKAKANSRFLACMARNAILRTPPLGFFREFVMEKDGKQSNSINIKRRGTAPLVDMIRVHALAIGSKAHNSFERLDDIIESKLLPNGRAEDLRDALELISIVRIKYQAQDLELENEPDNNIEPEALSAFERKNLKDAFQIVSDAQKFLRFKYQPGRAS
ncbi:DUF294 nucleotidyltransferase-like domain-containing protein [Catenovulum sp. 2E275]|uniref:DUF294 nucleotidyltransferase-like domain-containing protein n=1 Tax=Catenovulum sp. 2E275 TaxID=2980497 RepID=UPI0021D325CC|nr:DUF294 nucleotidyltransferase-like domain-containing protein [Catenovulum sp. 2E275]MCU4674305.1 DUF294 nucleotidyltransferase-like domain-containing protein [Catenovulum sp. 2E275]